VDFLTQSTRRQPSPGSALRAVTLSIAKAKISFRRSEQPYELASWGEVLAADPFRAKTNGAPGIPPCEKMALPHLPTLHSYRQRALRGLKSAGVWFYAHKVRRTVREHNGPSTKK
jgi:hypothetical protein